MGKRRIILTARPKRRIVIEADRKALVKLTLPDGARAWIESVKPACNRAPP